MCRYGDAQLIGALNGSAFARWSLRIVSHDDATEAGRDRSLRLCINGSARQAQTSMLKRLHLSLRFIVPLFVAMLALAYAAVPLVDTLTLRWFVRDLDGRSFLIGETLGESLIEQVRNNQWPRVDAMLDRAIRDERIYAVGICSPQGKLLRQGGVLPPTIGCSDAARIAGHPGEVRNLPTGPVHLSATELRATDGVIGTLLILHDMSFVTRRSEDTRKYVLLMFTALGVVVALITVAVAQLSWRGWVNGVRAMLRGEGVFRPFGQSPPELRPLVSDLRALLRDVHAERRMQDDSTAQWAPETLRRLLREQLSDDEVIVVSNREPYIHVHVASGVQVQRPASGLVTAVEPVMRACSGTWIAHGSGSADKETAGRDGRIKVPPGDPAYTLRRIWLTKEEEQGYYYGFANEGLWPLCHIAHVRPVFRSEDWLRYQQVNRRFADAVVAEADTEDPVVLVQDYHFALLPALVRERLPRATIITFWHIPWPNPESFGICPWREEILQGLLGSTIVGFHTRFHGNNFLQTVDRFLEARIENESSTIHAKGHLTQVESYPISIAWPPPQPVQADIADLPAVGAQPLQPRSGSPHRARCRSPRLHQGHHRTVARGRAAVRTASRVDRALHLRADRRAVALDARANTSASRTTCARSPRASTPRTATRATSRSSCCSSTTTPSRSTSTTAPARSAWSRACTTA